MKQNKVLEPASPSTAQPAPDAAWLPLGWQTDSEGRLMYADAAWLGFTRMDALENPANWMGAIHPDDLAALNREWSRVAQRSRPLEVRLRLRRHDGLHRWFLVRAVCDGGGGWRWSATDVHGLIGQLEHEREERDAALKDAFLARRQAQQALTDAGVAILEFDANRRLRFASREAAEVLGEMGCAFGQDWQEVMARLLQPSVLERLSRPILPAKSGPVERALGPVAAWVKVRPGPRSSGLTVLVRGRPPTNPRAGR